MALGIACGTFGADTSSPGTDDAGPNTDGSSSGADAPAEAAPPCDDAKVTDDPHHCGACGHDCLGGQCAAGVCQPVVLAQSPNDAPIFDVALLADSVVWATNDEPTTGGANHGLYFCPKTGCPTPPKNLTDDAHRPANIATDAVSKTYVSFPNQGLNGVWQANASGALTKIIGNHQEVHAMQVVADGLLYMALQEPNPGAYDRTIFLWDGTKEMERCVYQPTNGANTTTAAYANGFAFLGAVDISYIAACSLAGNTVTPFTTQTDTVASITASSGTTPTVFWTGGDDGLLYHCAAGATCAAPTMETGLTGFVRDVVALDKELLYATREGDLHACDPDRCPDTTLLVAHAATMGTSAPRIGHGLAADDTAFYFAAAASPLDGSGNATGWYLAKVAR
jgi:hypothetical protein